MEAEKKGRGASMFVTLTCDAHSSFLTYVCIGLGARDRFMPILNWCLNG